MGHNSILDLVCTSCLVSWHVQVKHDDLKEAAQRFVEELSAGKEFIADHKPAQTEVLDAGIKTIQEELASLLGSLHEGLYVDAGSPPADVVNSLEQLQERLAQLKVRSLLMSPSSYQLVAQTGLVCRMCSCRTQQADIAYTVHGAGLVATKGYLHICNGPSLCHFAVNLISPFLSRLSMFARPANVHLSTSFGRLQTHSRV